MSFLDIDHIMHAVLDDLNIRIKFRSHKALYALHAFLQTFLCIAALIHTADRNAVCRKDLL